MGICECAAPTEGVCVLETAQFHTCLILSELTVKDLWRRRLVVDVRRKLGATRRRTRRVNGAAGGISDPGFPAAALQASSSLRVSGRDDPAHPFSAQP